MLIKTEKEIIIYTLIEKCTNIVLQEWYTRIQGNILTKNLFPRKRGVSMSMCLTQIIEAFTVSTWIGLITPEFTFSAFKA